MRPNIKKQPYIPRDNENKARLDLYTGQYQKRTKKEQAPLFDLFKQDYLPDRNNIMNQVLDQAGRYRDETSTLAKNFETPIDKVKVPPGLDLGYNAEPTNRPFHPIYRQDEYTRDELTGVVRPDFSLDRTGGALMGEKTILNPEYEKKRPETVYGVPQGQVISNIFAPFSKQIKNADHQVEHLTQRGTQENTRKGIAGTTGQQKLSDHSLPKLREASKRKVRPEETGGITGIQPSNYKSNHLNKKFELKTPQMVEYQGNIAERSTLEPVVYMVSRSNGEFRSIKWT